MPTVNLTLSKSNIWMSNDYGISSENITVTIPSVLKGATFNSVSITYDTWYGSVNCKLCFSTGVYDYMTNGALLAKLQNGELDDVFSIQMVKYAKGIAQIVNLAITIDYNPASDVSGTINFGTDTEVWYSASAHSLCEGETMDLLANVVPEVDVHEVLVCIGTSSNKYESFSVECECPAGQGTLVAMHVTLGDTVWPSRVNDAVIRFALRTDDDDLVSSWGDLGEQRVLKLLNSRVAPTVSATWSDPSETLSQFGKFVQGHSTPRLALTVSLDTEADPDVALTSRVLTLEGTSGTQTAESGNNVIDVDALSVSGNVSYTVTVTDTYGVSGTASGTIDVLAYSPPSITSLSFERYAERETAQGESYYELDDSSPLIWTNIVAAVSALNGHNAWTLEAEYTDDVQGMLNNTPSNSITHTVTMASDTDGRAISAENDRTLFTPELLESSEWAITVTLTDYYGYTTKMFVVSKSGAIFDIEVTGVSVGKRSEGTISNPLFECAYEAHFQNDIYDKDGNIISGTVYSTNPTPCGTWIDGSTIYRVVITGISTAYGTHYIDLDFTVGTPIRMYGFAKQGTNWHPMNSYYTGSWRWYCRFSTASQLVYVASDSFTDGFIVIEYIPAAEQ